MPVSVNARQPSATMNAASPICDTVWPAQRKRKSRCRSAVRTRRRGGALTVPRLFCAHAGSSSRCVRPDDEPLGQGGEPGDGGAPRRAGRIHGRRHRRAPGEVERDRRAGLLPRRGRAARRRRVRLGHVRLGALARHHARRRLDRREARRTREALEHERRARPVGADRRRLPEDPSLRRRGGRRRLPRVRVRRPGRRARRRRCGGLEDRAHRLLRHPLPRALSHPCPRGRAARHRPRAFHDADRQGSLARPHARSGDREPAVRRRRGAGRRDATGASRLRTIAGRRSVGRRPGAGARRGDRHHRRDSTGRTSRTSARSSRRWRTGRRTHTGGRRGSDARRLARARPRPPQRMRRGVGAEPGRALSRRCSRLRRPRRAPGRRSRRAEDHLSAPRGRARGRGPRGLGRRRRRSPARVRRGPLGDAARALRAGDTPRAHRSGGGGRRPHRPVAEDLVGRWPSRSVRSRRRRPGGRTTSRPSGSRRDGLSSGRSSTM